MLHEDKAAYQTGVLSNGQLVYIDGVIVGMKEIDGKELDKLAKLVCGYGGDTCVGVSDWGRGLAVGIEDSFLTGLAARYPNRFDRLEGTLMYASGKSFIKANVRVGGGQNRLIEVRERLRVDAPSFDYVIPGDGPRLIEILPKGWGKAQGVGLLMSLLGIARDDVLVFGDAENDVGLFSCMTNTVAVGNACPEIRSLARWTIGRASEDSVANALLDLARSSADDTTVGFMR